MNKVEINKKLFYKLIQGAKPSISMDANETIQNFIQLNVNNNVITALTSNGFYASKVTLQLGDVDAGSFTCYIKPIDIDIYDGNEENIVVNYDADNNLAEVVVNTQTGLQKYVFEQPVGEFLNLESYFADTESYDRNIAINPSFLQKAAFSMYLTSESMLEPKMSIEFSSDAEKPLLIKNSDTSCSCEQLILPIKTK